MLRPDRRTRRAFAGLAVTVTTLALIWPVSIAAGRTTPTSPTSAAGAAGTESAAKHSDRQPTVHGLGIVHPKGTGHAKPTKPLQHLGANRSLRWNGTADGRSTRSAQATPPPSVQATTSTAPPATPFVGWDGLDQADSGFEPPDPWVAVGPDDVVQTVNTKLRFTNREGVTTSPDLDLSDFFAFDTWPFHIDGIGDPHFTYDAKHNRWLGITLAWHCDTDGAGANDDPIGYVWGAISLTGDPTGDYYEFFVDYHEYLPDFPGIGTSGDKFTISANEILLTNEAGDCTTNIDPTAGIPAASLVTFDWSQMLTYPRFPDETYDFGFDWYSLRPALSPQAASNTIFVVGEKLLIAGGDTTSNVVYMTLTGTTAGGGVVTSAEQDLTDLGVVPAFVDPPRPQQPGSTLPAGIVDRRPTDAIWQNNVLTFASTTGCDPAGGTVGENRDCARVTQLDTSTATPTRRQDMLIATTGKDTWYPGIGQSSSDILHVVYTQSSNGLAEGMSSYDRYQLPSDPVHKLSTAVKLANGGTVAYPGARWGDYVGVAQDPRDTNAVWQGNQYTHSGGTWATRISEIQTDGATYVPVTPVRLLDSRPGHNIGLSGVFQANIPRTVDIAGRGPIPDDAAAITGNLTVVGQTQAGYASVTPNPNANPSTASLNFPLGDGRGNNITVPLGATGGVSIVYKASPGKSAYFVLDVTGYFLNDETGATYKPIDPVRILDTRAGAGHIGVAGPIPANQNKEVQVWNVKGIPTTAIAVTGNLAVTGQTAAGYVSLSTTPPPAVPLTSNLNFPLGDTRANGLTIKLSPTGTFWAVYKAPNGKTAQLVFDVSGYYVQDLSGARFVPLTPGRRMDTRFAPPQEGLTGPFLAQAPRTLVIEPYQGVPGNAIAITGNLTVVGPSRAGYVSMTPTAVAPPPNATINFPAGDIRGNGATGQLSGPGSVAFVFMASGGSTHLVFDLTGYFRPATP